MTPDKMQNLVYEWVDFSKFGQIWAKIGSNLRKFWEKTVILFKIWPKIGPIGIWMGYFFLKNWYLYGSTFTRYFPKNIINHKFVQYILQVSSGNLKPMLK